MRIVEYPLEVVQDRAREREQLKEQLDICRQRVAELESAIEKWKAVMESTGKDREIAYGVMMRALVTDFRTAVITAPDMTDEQRSYWLSQPPSSPR